MSGWDELRRQVVEYATVAMEETARRKADDVRARASRRSLALVESIDVKAEDGPERLSRTIVAAAEHASWSEEGTGIYGPRGERITAKGGGVLAFYWPAAGEPRTKSNPEGLTFRKSVAGSTPTHFFSLGIAGWESDLVAAFR